MLIDDEPRGLKALHTMLSEYCPELIIVAECSDTDSAKKAIGMLRPELIFLDISLSGKSGFDLLTELETLDFEIIFATAHNQFALQAFRYSAVDYLLKPVDELLLIEAVKKAKRRISTQIVNDQISTLLHNLGNGRQDNEMKLCIPSQTGFQVVDLKDIYYMEASGSYTNIVLAGTSPICSSRGIYEYEEILGDSGFVRVHKSYLVNLRHIKEYIRGEGGSVVLSNNKGIDISRRKKEDFINTLKAFFKY